MKRLYWVFDHSDVSRGRELRGYNVSSALELIGLAGKWLADNEAVVNASVGRNFAWRTLARDSTVAPLCVVDVHGDHRSLARQLTNPARRTSGAIVDSLVGLRPVIANEPNSAERMVAP